MDNGDQATTEQVVAAEGNSDGSARAAPVRLERPARALVGWMAPEQANLFLCGKRMGETPSPEQLDHAERARRAVAARSPSTQDGNALSPLPDELGEFIAGLQANPVAAQYFAEGWDVAIADLARVRGFQPSVFTEQAIERVADVDPDDMRSLASLTLPTTQGTGFPVELDEQKKVFTIVSPDLNLRVMGHFVQQISDGKGGPTVPGIGFAVALLPSVMKVVEFQGAHYLADGYHRSFGLISRGITTVPVFARRVDAFEDLGVPAGMLPQGQYLGPRPPFLPDYRDDAVSAEVRLPVAQRMIVIQALELTPSG